ncbi:MAG: alpha/beta hydrolase [Candidatus Pacebacteria bacterium]|nr:alpha/beta hydrolase [Candidatus Paceibacterota bacterium]
MKEIPGKKIVMVQGQEVWYSDCGEGLSILILAGWGGPTNAYGPFQQKLAAKGYRVVMPDLPGLGGRTSARYIALSEWGDWVNQFAKLTIGNPFVLFSHSGSASIALSYLHSEHPECLANIYLGPGLVNYLQGLLWRAVNLIGILQLVSMKFSDMKCLRNKLVNKTGRNFLTPVREEAPKIPCVVFLGSRDPVRFFFTGWKKLNCPVRKFNWDHSPQIRATDELVKEIDRFIKEIE